MNRAESAPIHLVEDCRYPASGLRQRGITAFFESALQAGGHWFEPGTAHSKEARLLRGSLRVE
jgi:hypothetical protein